jgi:uncharacterized protein YceH (UPF0502 family)
MGAVAEVQSGGRVPKFRHYLYEWLGVDKVELAVLAELLLRGEQTVGELRGHASRMEPIADLNALHAILEALVAKELVVLLTPSGRGQVVTHNLYTPERLEELKSQFASGQQTPDPAVARVASSRPSGISLEQFSSLESEVAELRAEIARINAELNALRNAP